MGYRIGLDLGIASVGWAAIEDDANGNPKRIIDLGSRIFDAAENPKDGSPLAKDRRDKRELRRRLRRRNHRVQRTKRLLEKYKIISVKELENLYRNSKFQCNPYELRVKALDQKISNNDLARVLVSLVKKRGYKSNSKSEENDKENGKLLTATKENEKLMIIKGYRTIAEMYLKDDKFKIEMPDGNKLLKIKNSTDDYKATPLRKLIVQEIKMILNTQKQYNNLITEQFILDYLNIFESQRNFDEGPGGDSPYGGNQIEKMLGKCTFEKDEYRAPKACFTFEYFKLLQDINHIKIEENELINNKKIVEKRDLSETERNLIINLVKNKTTVTYDSLRKTLNLSPNERFNMVEYKSTNEFTIEKNKEAEKERKFKEFESYHKIRIALDKYEKEYIKKLNQDQLDIIGYGLSVYKNDNKRIEYFQQKNLNIPKEAINELLKLSFSKVGNLSLKCMKKIIPSLEKGLTYDKAVDTVYTDFRGIVNTKKKRRLSIFDLEQSISNPVVRRAISQSIKVINAITLKYNPIYGKPDVVVIELAREVGKNFNDRNKIKKYQEENRARNEFAKQEINSLGKENVTGQDIVKYKLWKEQSEICMYSGKHINIEDLFTEAVDIDHIIPYSMCFDDSYTNKVLVLASENRQKGNRVPYQYMQDMGRNLDEYEVRINSFIKNYKKKQRLLRNSFNKDDLIEWKERNIKDTQYISKLMYNLIRNYLEFSNNNKFKRKVYAVNGAFTSYIRKRLGIQKIRENGDEHHAVDAVVISTVSQGMINKLTKYAQYIDAKAMNNKGEYIDFETGEIISRNQYEEKNGKEFPEPWINFRKELEIRSNSLTKDEMEECIKACKLYTYDEHDDGIDRHNDLEPIFVSRMPRRKVKGPAHLDTIRGVKKENGIIKKITKTPLCNLKLNKNGEIDKYPEKQKQDDKILYKALVDRLKKYDGDGKKAFSEKFYKPKSDGTLGPIVKKVKLEDKSTMVVQLKKENAIADNGSMVRIDVFYVPNEGYYFVPIYVSDTIKAKLPNKACVANKNYEQWKEMKDESFIFSLYPNDLIYIKGKNKIKLQRKNDSLKDSIEVNALLAYYIKAGISSASITIINHDEEYIQPSLGIKSLQELKKYEVDILGNYHEVKLPEKRMKFNIKKN